MSPLISIIMTVYNRDRYLSDAIESVLHQTDRHFELVLWDDGSSDRSVEIARRFADADPRVRFIAAPHQGRAEAWKAAHAAAQGDYLGTVDSDDLLAPKALQATRHILDAHPAIGVVYTDHILIDAHSRPKAIGQRCRIPYSPHRLLSCFMTFHFRLIRRSAFEQAGGIDSSYAYAEDYDLCLRLSEVTQFHHLKRPLYYYRQHSASIGGQHHAEQRECGRRAIAAALQRRGWSNRLNSLLAQHEVRLQR